MNIIKSLTAAAIISTVSLSSFAAQEIRTVDDSMEKVAVISVLGASTPDELAQRLSEKADSVGANKFKITMTSSSENSETGTAVAYK